MAEVHGGGSFLPYGGQEAKTEEVEEAGVLQFPLRAQSQ
jgi:hypothetical protein